MPTYRMIRFDSSSLRWRDYQKAILRSRPAPRARQCSRPPRKSSARRHVPHDDEFPRAIARAEPQPPPQQATLRWRDARSRLVRELSVAIFRLAELMDVHLVRVR